ncbi:MAG: malto-oligosyltrehalose synthase [Desulfosarcina sp.]
MPIPSATYRLQFQPDFGFRQAAEILPYLSALGVSHIYASPILAARKGSQHGYDGVDPDALNPELGGADDWQSLVEGLRQHRIGWLQDIVPNHMAFDPNNRMLADLFENGPASPFHGYFDICWNHPAQNLRGKVAAPFLGRRYTDTLKRGDIRLTFDADGFGLTVPGLKFPLLIESYSRILESIGPSIKIEIGEDQPDCERWVDTLDLLESLALENDAHTRQEQVRSIKQALWDLHQGNRAVGRAIARVLDRFNGNPGDIESFRHLDRLLSRQQFRLCYWKVANEEINYRRFLDINGLIALRQERETVFRTTHARLFELADQGIVDGVRIDHVDGLADPAGYLHRLRRHLTEKAYILVEKILSPEEPLPTNWPIQGTTGYDFSYWVNAVFVNPDHQAAFSRTYARFTDETDSFQTVVVEAKKEILYARMAGDLDNLARRFKTVSSSRCFADSLSLVYLKEALAEILVHFSVYRTYIEPGSGSVRKADREAIEAATTLAMRYRPNLTDGIAFVRDLLLVGMPIGPEEEDPQTIRQYRSAVRSFQQLSAALMAKGFEDTAFYRYHRLVSLNDVGGEPGRFGCSVDEFHGAIQRRAARWPHAMNSTATHDSKRGEDVRARLNVLSEIPERWAAVLDIWHELIRGGCRQPPGGQVPDKKTEILLFQTLIGVWPPDGILTPAWVARVQEYMRKAAREAGQQTSWLEPRQPFEDALNNFVASILDSSPHNTFLPVFRTFCERITFFGLFNTLSQCLLKITAPGVPDFYQGTELPQLVLVDPDNRQPVLFAQRRRQLDAMRDGGDDRLEQVANLLHRREDGRIKLYTIARALEVRSRLGKVFETGRYLPLNVAGPLARHILAFAREADGRWCIVAVPRFLTALVEPGRDPLGQGVWGRSRIILPADAPSAWRNLFSGQRIEDQGGVAASLLFEHFPVALLEDRKPT